MQKGKIIVFTPTPTNKNKAGKNGLFALCKKVVISAKSVEVKTIGDAVLSKFTHTSKS